LEGEEKGVRRLSVVLMSELAQHQESESTMMLFVELFAEWNSDLVDKCSSKETPPR